MNTDRNGQFLLARIPAGHFTLVVDGQTAHKGGATYGQYEIGVNSKSGKTNHLPFTIWLTKLDTAHYVAITLAHEH